MSGQLFSLTDPNATLPTRATSGSAGYDFYSLTSFEVLPGEQSIVETGVKAHFTQDRVLFIKSRSGLTVRHMITAEAGVIDSDYNDTIKVVLRNFSKTPYKGYPGERIAQGVFLLLAPIHDEVKTTRDGGFGSTGN